jgi:hypothetical protein
MPPDGVIRCSPDGQCPTHYDCIASTCWLHGHGPDLSSGDDGGPPDDGPTTIGPPRLISPISTSTVTQKKPTLRWVRSGTSGTIVVDLCKDRSCNTLLPGVGVTLAADSSSAVPTAPLPSGWTFWRVRAIAGSDTETSPVWQFWVGKASATTSVDTAAGSILDVNGDGFADFLIGSFTAGSTMNVGAAHLYLGNANGSGFQRIDLVSPEGVGSYFGTSVANAGDVNGDGFGDFVIGAEGGGFVGAVHLYLGGPVPTASEWNGTSPAKRIDLTPPDGVSTGFGGSVASAGDIDGDGYADLLAGAANAGGVGAAHVYLGAGLPSASDYNGIGAGKRIDLVGPSGGVLFGARIANAGDVNGDGFADFIISDPVRGDFQTGAVFLYLGKTAPSVADWTGMAPPQRIDLTNPDGNFSDFGYSVSSAGDVNDDGYSDFIVGSDQQDGNMVGVAHLYLGEKSVTASDYNGPAFSGPAPPRRIDLTNPTSPGDIDYGVSVANAGDVDGDGFADFLVGSVGSAHLYLGEQIPSNGDWNGMAPPKRVDLANPDGMAAHFGGPVAGVGDSDGDGFSDFIVSAMSGNSSGGAGAVNLYLGSATPSMMIWNGASAAKRVDFAGPDGTNGSFGSSVARVVRKRSTRPSALTSRALPSKRATRTGRPRSRTAGCPAARSARAASARAAPSS